APDDRALREALRPDGGGGRAGARPRPLHVGRGGEGLGPGGPDLRRSRRQGGGLSPVPGPQPLLPPSGAWRGRTPHRAIRAETDAPFPETGEAGGAAGSGYAGSRRTAPSHTLLSQ